MEEKIKNNDKEIEKVIDYYEKYGIERGTDIKDIKTILRRKHGEIRAAMSNASLNGAEILERLEKQSDEISKAIYIFKDPNRIEEYNQKLDKYKRSLKDQIQNNKQRKIDNTKSNNTITMKDVVKMQ